MTRRTTLHVALAVYLGVLARVTLWPAPADEPVEREVGALLQLLERLGVGWLDYEVLEAAANVVLFVPFGGLLVLLLPRRLWWLGIAVPAAVSIGIELTQLVALPRRFATVWDVVMNTTGATAGAALVWLHGSRPVRRPRRSPRGAPSAASGPTAPGDAGGPVAGDRPAAPRGPWGGPPR